MHTYPLAEYMRAIEADQWHEVARLLLASANLLVRAGAEILICPDNTVHQARYLMEGPVYPAQLTARNIAFEIPEPFDRERIDAIIFDELTYGHFERRSKQYMLGVIDALRTRGCDGVVLGCTEIPLLIAEAESPLPAIDSTRTLARAALRAAAQPGRS